MNRDGAGYGAYFMIPVWWWKRSFQH